MRGTGITLTRYALQLALSCAAALTFAQEYPSRPIRIVSPGGNADFTSRVIAQGLAAGSGWQVIVENRPGGIVPSEVVAKAPADGYTLLVNGNILWISPLLGKVPFDPVADFAPITLIHVGPSILVVTASLPVKSVADLIALARARPGELNYASGVPGAASHLAAELFKSMAKVNMVRIAYPSPSQELTELIAGQVQVSFQSMPVVEPHLRSGRLRALGVGGSTPSPRLPEVPAIATTVPGYQAGLITGMFAPAQTPAAVISRLNQEMLRTLARTDVKEKFVNAGVEPVGSTPKEMMNRVKSEIARWDKLIKTAGIAAQ